MKSFLNFLSEVRTSNASQEAAKRGWTGDGHGSWFDKEGNLVARTERGRLVQVDTKQAAKDETPGQQLAQRERDDDAFGSPRQKHTELESPWGKFSDGKPRTMPPPLKADGSPKEDLGDVTIVFGRFNPPTIGHQKLLDQAKKSAGKGKLRIYPSKSQDSKKNPLDSQQKHEVMQQMFPDHAGDMVNDPNARTIFDVLKQAYDDGYSSVNIVAGGSRVKEFDKLAKDYNGKIYDFGSLKTTSAGERDESKGGVEAVSASKQRKAAAENDFEEFLKGLPAKFAEDEKVAKQLFNTVRKQMKVQKEGWNLWEIAPSFDWKNLRENYINGKIFKVDQWVENLNTGLIGKIIRRGTNYLICVTEDNIMFKSWMQDLNEYTEKKSEKKKYGDDSIDREPGKPNTLVGTTGYLKYAMKMTGTKKIKNFNVEDFINKYKKKST